jgi:hypothetical protein
MAKTTMIVDIETRNDIKILAAMENKTMTDFMKDMVKKYKEDKSKKDVKNVFDGQE